MKKESEGQGDGEGIAKIVRPGMSWLQRKEWRIEVVWLVTDHEKDAVGRIRT